MHVYDEDGHEWAAKQFESAEDGGVDTTTLREIGLLRALRAADALHANIVVLADMASINGELCMIMANYKCSLRDALAGGALTTSKGVQVSVAHGLLSAVAFLHSCKAMHRDIKPGNVMLTDDLEPVLIDFSLGKVDLGNVQGEQRVPRTAKERRKKAKKKTLNQPTDGEDMKHSQGVGTPLYMAPEVIDSAEYGASADMWSLGVVLLEVFDAEFCAKFDQCEKEKTAHALIAATVARLGSTPIPAILRDLLQVDAAVRESAEGALGRLRDAMPPTTDARPDLPAKQLGSLAAASCAAKALPEEIAEEIQLWTSFFRCSPRVRHYAAMYVLQSATAHAAPLHAVVLAGRLHETDMDAAPFYDLEELEEWACEEGELEVITNLQSLEAYVELEKTILKELDYMVY
eukprot:gnl/TRDRNA2_/TRDRNA2_107886_c1_seq1.p1 gnl/TRDRNA2_/TRDRNA2_107886_c1~~gnl/TRDRNA2_/TRDRNA2_107886_c1_seq1.p1  ORF type:complete len:426 (-),score=92.89 gnl/TRDRNA2_/TRDRNA2_107886_c1_seq1:112-1323(-)